MFSSDEDIKQANAAELGHLTNQLVVSARQRELLSQFLVKSEGTAFSYNMALKECISWLKDIPFSEEFVKRLVYLDEPPADWERHLPIEYTPKTHIIHGVYRRIVKSSIFRRRDPHYGLPLPKIFHRETNIITETTQYTIDLPDKLYEVHRPFGYNFPEYIVDDCIVFKLVEIWNPLYVKRSAYNSKYLGAPTPITTGGKRVEPYSNMVYTLLYKRYIATCEKV
jgi:hypothetical protein